MRVATIGAVFTNSGCFTPPPPGGRKREVKLVAPSGVWCRMGSQLSLSPGPPEESVRYPASLIAVSVLTHKFVNKVMALEKNGITSKCRVE